MQRVVVQIPMSKELKEKADLVSADLGFSSLQEVIRVLLTKLSKKEFNLKVEEGEYPSKSLIKTIKQAEKDRKAGKASPIFRTGEEAVKWLEEQGI